MGRRGKRRGIRCTIKSGRWLAIAEITWRRTIGNRINRSREGRTQDSWEIWKQESTEAMEREAGKQ